jgi:spore germination cell wall hydrolase CwlJ-like protein
MATIMATTDRTDGHGRARRVAIVLMLAAFAITAALAGIGLMRGAVAPVAGRAAPQRRTVAPPPTLPATPPPPVQPTVLADLTTDQARLSNAAVPYAAGKPPVPTHFVYTGSALDRDSALTCLAAAALYEAGDDKSGEQAVAQVVLNRLRHPAFPKTVCGVVFQGSDRSTGCQFTFTCDGALDRPVRPEAWRRARAIADAALSGFVDAAVGTATHYHTDWVVPYWRDTLTKVAKVGTQIFYRWPGAWGGPRAFAGQPQPFERLDPRLVSLAGPGHTPIASEAGTIPVPSAAALPLDTVNGEPAPEPAAATVAVPGVSHAALRGSVVRLADNEAGQFVLQLESSAPAAGYAETARALCRDHPDCLVFGWLNRERMPRRLPILPLGLQGMTFMYRKNSLLHSELPYWNCRQKPRDDAGQCLPGTR